MSIKQLDLSGFQPRWLVKQAADHYSESERQNQTPQRRAWHRQKWLEYTTKALPVLGLEAFLERFKQHCRYDSWLTGEGQPIIRALAATLPQKAETAEVAGG